MRKISLVAFAALTLASEAQAQCLAPANAPTNMQLTPTATAITVSFNGAQGGATGYLIVRSDNATAVGLPQNNTSYSGAAALGATTFAYDASTPNVQATGLTGGTTYYFTAFAYNKVGNTICYNTTALTGSAATLGQQGGNGENEASNNSRLNALLNFNFAGKQNGWSNLTPIIFYGWSVSNKETDKHGHTVQIGPYVGSTINIKDSSSYLPGVMLPGNAGLEANYYLTFGQQNKFRVVVCPLNLGLKVVSGFKDSNLALVQHNIRHSIGIEYADRLSASAQFTQGWHNSTQLSQENFQKVFGTSDSHIAYWNVTLTTRLSESLFGNDKKAPLYLSINWRSLARPSGDLALPNARFFTIGLLASLDLKSGTNPGLAPHRPL